MIATDCHDLLREYAHRGSEAAFRAVVDRYMNLVYSTALRSVDGDRHLAEDVAQAVFIDLARRSRNLSTETRLGGWLHRRTCNIARTLMRSNRRREAREQRAAELAELDMQSAVSADSWLPLIDRAIDGLRERDRTAILLRFFEQRDFRSIANTLGCNEDAARMRVSRALEKLQVILKREGVAIPTTTLATALSAGAISAAPAGLAVPLSTAAFGGAAISTSTLPLTTLFMSLNAKTVFVGTAALAAIVFPWVSHRQATAEMRRESRSIRQVLNHVRADNERLTDSLATSRSAEAASQEQLSELMKLRSEVGELRKRQAELQLLLSTATTPDTSGRQEPPAGEVPVTINKADWIFAGYATPEAALQSFMWSMREGDFKSYLASLSPEARESAQAAFEGTPEAEAGVRLQAELRGIEGLRFKRKATESQDEVAFVVAASERDNGSVRMRSEAVLRFKNIGGEWKSIDAAN